MTFWSDLSACTTWECVNGFAAWLSAFGTICVSGIALWLSFKDRRICLNAVFCNSLMSSNNPNVLDTWNYALTCVNVGHRSVTITNYHWKLLQFPFTKKNKIVTYGHTEPVISAYCSRLPIELTDGKQAQFFFLSDFFETIKDNDDFLFCSTNKWVALLRISTFNLYIDTSVGKAIKVKTSFSMRRNLWRKYIKITSSSK
ncbi:hypothetical protein PVK62_17400 [Aliivibrio sp. S3MY1]|uniref:hypothetical protein n=1 Tax=unclassified Aliivibrio TaxID=2645654 RepID=UPI00237976C3|nr:MULTISPECIES: hypothetical protein [unclassified Aliivibrio]MDD9197594.1 hypothetical protein [Aliivibrio sp. S3MY1]MDD9200845.1 hypothetical protein [Aliivibrio sp. S2MY1]